MREVYFQKVSSFPSFLSHVWYENIGHHCVKENSTDSFPCNMIFFSELQRRKTNSWHILIQEKKRIKIEIHNFFLNK